jgi:hypothetical protein
VSNCGAALRYIAMFEGRCRRCPQSSGLRLVAADVASVIGALGGGTWRLSPIASLGGPLRDQHQTLELGDQDPILIEHPGMDFDDAAVGLRP